MKALYNFIDNQINIKNGKATIDITYEGILASDLPNGLKKVRVLN